MDYDYLSASNGSGDAALMVVQSPGRLIGATVIPVLTVSNVPNKFIATSGTLLSNGLIDASTKCDFKAHKSGTTIVIDSFEPGSTDSGHTAGQVIVIKPTTGWTNRVASVVQAITGFATAINGAFAALTATSLTTTADATVGGNGTVNGKLTVNGSMQAPVATVVTVDGSNNLTPSKQIFDVTALDHAATIQAPTFGTWNGAACVIRIFSASAYGLTFASAYTNQSGLPTPTTTVAGKWLVLGVMYNSLTSKWQILSISQEA